MRRRLDTLCERERTLYNERRALSVTLPCVVLAGGLATRMRPATEKIPKALLPVGGRPFVDTQVSWLRDQGVEHVVFSVGYRGDAIREHLGNGARFGVHVDYVDDGPMLLGTGGAVRLVVDSGLVEDAFFVLNGDSYLSVDFDEFEKTFRRVEYPALMTVFQNRNQGDVSNAVVGDGRVLLYDKLRSASPGEEMEWIDYGLSILRSDVILKRVPPALPFDLADLMHELSLEGLLGCYEVQHRFYEVGSPRGLAELEAHLLKAKP